MKKQIVGMKIIISLLLIVVMMVFSSCSINIIGREIFTEADTDLSIETSDNQQPTIADEPVIMPITENYNCFHSDGQYSGNEYYKFYTSDNYDVLEVKFYYGNDTGGRIIKLYFDENGKIQNNSMDSFDSYGDIISTESMFIKYDEQSNISFISFNDYRFDYKHNSSGQITEIKKISPNSQEPLIKQLEYDSQNRLIKFSEYSILTEFEYNDKGLITSITESSPYNVNESVTATITYNEKGQIASAVTNYVYSTTEGRTEEQDFEYDDSNNLIFKSSLWSSGGYNQTEYEHSNDNGTKTVKIKDLSLKYTLFNDTQISSSEEIFDNRKYTHDYEYKTLTEKQAHMYDIYNNYFTFFYVESRPFYIDTFAPTSQAAIIMDRLPYFYRDVGYYPYIVYKAIIDIYK